jgi:hypothetical protein
LPRAAHNGGSIVAVRWAAAATNRRQTAGYQMRRRPMFFDLFNMFNVFGMLNGHSSSNVTFVNQGNVQIALNLAINSPGAVQNITNFASNNAIIFQR